jgi:hypothetical protein
MSKYASVNISGTILPDSCDVGIFPTLNIPTPVCRVRVIAGLQTHPVWAIDNQALLIYSWALHAQHQGIQKFEAVLSATLISDDDVSLVVVDQSTFYNFSCVREDAIRTYTELKKDNKWLNFWPQEVMTMPVSFDTIARRNTKNTNRCKLLSDTPKGFLDVDIKPS